MKIQEIKQENIEDDDVFRKVVKKNLLEVRSKVEKLYDDYSDFFGDLLVMEGSYRGLSNIMLEIYVYEDKINQQSIKLPIMLEMSGNYSHVPGHVSVKNGEIGFACYMNNDDKYSHYGSEDISIVYSNNKGNTYVANNLLLNMGMTLNNKNKAIKELEELGVAVDEIRFFYKTLKEMLTTNNAYEFINCYKEHTNLIHTVYFLSEDQIKESIIKEMKNIGSPLSMNGLNATLDLIKNQKKLDKDDVLFKMDSIYYFVSALDLELKSNIGWAETTNTLLLKEKLNDDLVDKNIGSTKKSKI